MKKYYALLILVCLSDVALGAGDPQRGARLFGQCAACHSVQEGEHMTGPSLAHAWNHKAGTAKGFMRYSDAVKRSEAKWDVTTLDMWLRNPAQLIPGNNMTFPGVKEAKDRADLIAYLKAVDENKAPQALSNGAGMMGMHGARLDLKNAPPAGLVRSIKYCGDTYTLETGDGKTEKFWEFNLRFKSDSSKLGPAPGKPVVIGAGMLGDRASVVFASPMEISEAIKLSCP
jgi:cytochrome c